MIGDFEESAISRNLSGMSEFPMEKGPPRSELTVSRTISPPMSASDEEPQEEEPAEQPKKRKKKPSLRAGHTKEERAYADTQASLLAAIWKASASFAQSNVDQTKKDTQRKQRQELVEQAKREKREARFARSVERKKKLRDAAASTITDKKKLLLRESKPKRK
jgi:hypothetical protein